MTDGVVHGGRVTAGEAARVRELLGRVRDIDPETASLNVVSRRAAMLTLRAECGATAFAVSVPGGDPPSPDRTRERARVLDAVSSAGVAPRCRFADPASGILVTDWAPGPPWSRDALRAPERLRALASTLAAVHRLVVAVPPLDVVGWADAYRRRIFSGGAVDDPVARELDELGDLAADHVATRSVATLGHNDVTAGNILGMPRPVLIDWEYAGRSDPLFDLATVVALHRLGDAGRTALVDAYETAGAPPVDRDRLPETERLIVLLTRAWSRSERLDHPTDPRATAWL